MSRIGHRQQERLLDHMERHPMLARVRVNMGKRSNKTIKKKWDELAEVLNATGDGAPKTGQQWKRYWINLKSRVKARAVTERQERDATGGGLSKELEFELSEYEKRILTIVGHEAVYGDETVPGSMEDTSSAPPVLPRTSTTSPPAPLQTHTQPTATITCTPVATLPITPVDAPKPEPDESEPYAEPPTWYAALEGARLKAERENTELIVNAIDRLTAVVQAYLHRDPLL